MAYTVARRERFKWYLFALVFVDAFELEGGGHYLFVFVHYLLPQCDGLAGAAQHHEASANHSAIGLSHHVIPLQLDPLEVGERVL